MQVINAIASILNISENQISSVDEWDKVYFVRFNVGRPTFVSKAKVQPFTFTLSAGRRGAKPWVAKVTGLDGGIYGFAREFVDPASIEWAGKKGCKSATYSLNEEGIYQDSSSGYYRVYRAANGVLTYEEISYDEVKYTLKSVAIAA
jgi:hypothetical protein